MYRDNQIGECFFNCLRAMYGEHPVKIDIAGTVESIQDISKELLYKCYNTFIIQTIWFIYCRRSFPLDRNTTKGNR